MSIDYKSIKKSREVVMTGERKLTDNEIDFHNACLTLDLEKIQYLIKNRVVDINSSDKWGNTPLLQACSISLISHDESKYSNVPSEERTANLAAFEKQRIEVLDLLIKNGAKLNVKDNSGKTPLLLASELLPAEKNTEKYLESKGAKKGLFTTKYASQNKEHSMAR